MIARFAIPFFFIMGLVVVPLVLTLLCRWLVPRKHWKKAAFTCTFIIWALVLYGHFVGYRQLVVRQVEFVNADLPSAFDGYRIVQFSDAHIATMTGYNEWLLKRAVDSINAQHADMIVFTGDMQNVYPQELTSRASVLRQLHAKDGVYAILGNHDYAVYQSCDSVEKERNCQQTIAAFRQMGFTLLLNENRIICRDSDSIVIAGMENWGKVKRMPRKGDVKKTLEGVSDSAFVVMLQHDPSCWDEHILPECQAQLTLSGHTHGGQFALFGWSPVAFNYKEWAGTYYHGNRMLQVSTGLGALIPFRLGQPGEIVVITLRGKK
jgi:predicted MPP superfamily phosphohydrolase